MKIINQNSVVRFQRRNKATPLRRNVVRAYKQSNEDMQDTFLSKARSFLMRGKDIHCVECKGRGEVCCSQCFCKGSLKPHSEEAKSQYNAVGHVGEKALQILGMHDNKNQINYRSTNRCNVCHGTGAVPCSVCAGAGVINPSSKSK